MEVVSSMKGFEMMIGSLKHSEHNGSLLHHVHNYDCLSFKLSPKDIHDFITSGSFMLTFFDELQAKLPDWLRFSKSGTGLLAVTDLKTDLIRGNNMNSIQECRDAPVHKDRLYNRRPYLSAKDLKKEKLSSIFRDSWGSMKNTVPPESWQKSTMAQNLFPLTGAGSRI
jgi:hypothetical protein